MNSPSTASSGSSNIVPKNVPWKARPQPWRAAFSRRSRLIWLANAERLILRASMQDNKHHRIHEQKKALKESNSGPDVQTEKAKDAFARKRKALEVAATAPVNLRLSATSRYTNPLPPIVAKGEELAEAAGEPLRALVDLPNNLNIEALALETVAPKGKIDAAPGQTCHLHFACTSLNLWLMATAGTREDKTTPSSQNREDPTAIQMYDPNNLPLRSEEEIISQGKEVEAEAERLAKKYGVKGVPILSYLKSLSFPRSFPFDFMHLIWENLVKNLVLLWTGDFKALDEGEGEYELAKTVWEAIAVCTSSAGDNIQSAYGSHVPNIDKDRRVEKWTCRLREWLPRRW
ncbi:hypothetical protein B0H10DRAFT_2229498 [Mycena sp. CBHHK59/15]|nr:hypothetical protein B0H10DRAFT_2229498 [Mycena sp. CBHHK59/15]